jgi:hypothetical protein
MTTSTDISLQLKYDLKELLNWLPKDFREDEHVQQVIMLFLKTGGKSLAAHYIKMMATPFKTDFDLIRKRAAEEELKEDAEEETEGEKPDDEDETVSPIECSLDELL